MAALAESAGVESPSLGLEQLSFEGVRMPVTLRLSEPMSDQELIAFSRRNRPYRIELNTNGELEIMSPVGHDGAEREQYVAGELYLWTKANGGHTFSPSAGFKLGESSVRSPDASWISDELDSGLSPAQRRGFPPICPEFLIELLSESDRRATLEAKMEMWIASGAQLAWMIDPYAATVSIYRPNAAVEVLERPDSVEAGKPVAGFRLETAKLWDR